MTTEKVLVNVFWPEPRLAPIAARNWMKARILSGTPTSLIRLGDGEFSWLGYGSAAPWDHTAFSLNDWFGRDDFESTLLEQTAERMRLAVRRASLIGIPRPSRQLQDSRCGYVRDLFEQHELICPGQIFTDCGVHRFWQLLLAFRDLLAGLPFVGLISSPNIGNEIRTTFGITEVVTYPIPSQQKILGDFESLGSHYPERFKQLCDELIVPFPGAVFLIGAGGLGKIYADIIFQRGGIALDVGSVLDGWAGKASRGFIANEPALFGLSCYDQSIGLEPAKVVARYRDKLRGSSFGHIPTDEEFAFYEAMPTAIK